MEVVEEEEWLLNKFKEMMKIVMEENGQKAKLKYFNRLISKETAKRHGKGQNPYH